MINTIFDFYLEQFIGCHLNTTVTSFLLFFHSFFPAFLLSSLFPPSYLSIILSLSELWQQTKLRRPDIHRMWLVLCRSSDRSFSSQKRKGLYSDVNASPEIE
jgi:hypothetical protein